MALPDIVIIANPIILGIIAVFGRIWTGKRLKKIEVSLAKKQYIHQIQFNREFNIYQALWKKLVTLIRRSEFLLCSGFFNLQNPQDDSRGKELEKTLTDTYQVLVNNIPFFSPAVYKPARKIFDLLNKETESVRLGLRPLFVDPGFEDYDKVKEAITEIRPYVKEVEEAIRERIYGKEEK